MKDPFPTIVAIAMLVPACGPTLPQLGSDPIPDVVAAMTTEEKALLLVGMGMILDIPGIPSADSVDAAIPEKVPGAAGRTHAIPRLGIPSLTLSDGPAGVRINPTREAEPSRTFHATAFPVATLLASSWDTALVREVGAFFGHEALEYGVDVILAPGMNIQRNPLCGRNFEYYSEDPLVSGTMAAAFVRGVQSAGVGTSVKHFVANNQELNRTQSNSIVSTRALREIYLRGFEIAVRQARPWTVMTSYNFVNGTYASESRPLLADVLRGDWGFDGFVTTDWFGGKDPVAQMAAGNDMIMPGNPGQTRAIVEAVESGMLDAAVLDANVERVLRVILQSPTFKKVAYSDQPDLERSAQVARRAAAESMVLLKNEGETLPLEASASVALFGTTSYELIVGGTGSGDVNEAYAVPLQEGLESAGFTVDSLLSDRYTAYVSAQRAAQGPPPMPFMPAPPIPEMPLDAQEVQRAVDASSAAVITIGRLFGEFRDREVVDDFLLTAAEQRMIRDVSGAFRSAGKPVVVVLNVGGVTEVVSWRDQADAILVAWQPGQEGGHAIADVLSGRINPSGKLAQTIPVAYGDVSSAINFPGTVLPGPVDPQGGLMAARPTEVVYEEGIFVGYRYFDTFEVKPAYEFGYGLSYTRFAYAEPQVGAAQFEGSLAISVTITNAGTRAGKEVVQVYVSAPAGTLAKPKRELRAFGKTGQLEPAASETLHFTLAARDLASFDPDRSAWIIEPGTYTLRIGASSQDIRQAAEFEVPTEIVVEPVSRSLEPRVMIQELIPGR